MPTLSDPLDFHKITSLFSYGTETAPTIYEDMRGNVVQATDLQQAIANPIGIAEKEVHKCWSAFATDHRRNHVLCEGCVKS